jgi:polar amino acid transport system substrate-binding protein
VDLNETARTALRLMTTLIEKSTEHLGVTCDDSIPLIRGSAQRIEQVIVNLLMNACQALPGPDRAISLATFVDPGESVVVLEVRDEGTGISPEHLAHLTDPFFTTKRESGGTGLGLSVSAGIVKEHGGSLTFSSLPGAGTTARLTLPIPGKGNQP